MHQKANNPLIGLVDEIKRINNLVANDSNITGLINGILISKQQIESNFSQAQKFESSFVELTKYIIKRFHVDSFDEFLTETGLKVTPTFAQVAEYLGETISAENIDDKGCITP